MFIGSGIYPMSAGYLLSNLYAHGSWAPQSYSPRQMIERIVEDNQGNLAQVWGYSRGYAPTTHAEWFYALDEIGINVPEPERRPTATRRYACTLRLREQEAAGPPGSPDGWP